MQRTRVKTLLRAVLLSALPSVWMLCWIWFLSGGVDILAGLFIFFPLAYIGVGAVATDPWRELLPALICTSLAFLLPINLCFHMGSCIGYAVVYCVLAGLTYAIKRYVQSKRNRKTN